MGKDTAIEWCDHTVNFWWGCTKVGPGCDHCYAEGFSKRTGHDVWGAGKPRRKIASAAGLMRSLNSKSNDFSAVHGRAQRVFVQSMSDLFDNEVDRAWRYEACAEIADASNLNVMIVTKRVSNVMKLAPPLWIEKNWPRNAGLIITVVNQEEADRDVPRLLDLKHRLAIPWVGLSIEPMLGPMNISQWMHDEGCEHAAFLGDCTCTEPREVALDFVIVGGESGPGARPMHPDWPRSIRDQCAAAGVAFFFKQWGEWHPVHQLLADGNSNTMTGREHPDKWHEATLSGRVGKRRAGRLLDGRTHDEYPEQLR